MGLLRRMGLLGSAEPSLDGPSPYTGGESVDICIGTTLRVSFLALPPLDKLGSWSWVACTELPASSSREGSVSAASRYVLIHCVIRALLCSRDIGLAENSYQRLTTASGEVLGDLRGASHSSEIDVQDQMPPPGPIFLVLGALSSLQTMLVAGH